MGIGTTSLDTSVRGKKRSQSGISKNAAEGKSRRRQEIFLPKTANRRDDEAVDNLLRISVMHEPLQPYWACMAGGGAAKWLIMHRLRHRTGVLAL
jgi:hypothetical protein